MAKKQDEQEEEHVEKIEEEVSSEDSTENSRLVKWGLGGILLIVLLGFVFAHGNDMVAKPFIEEQLANVSNKIKTQAELSGDSAELSYGEIEVHGGVFNKSAKIKDIKLDYMVQLPFGNVEHTIISAPLAVVTADQISANAINIRFPKPLTIERQGQEPLELSFDGKPTYHYVSESGSEEHSIKLPPKARIIRGAGGADPVEVTITYDDNAKIHRVIHERQATSSGVVTFKNIKLVSNIESNEIAIAHLGVNTLERGSRDDANSRTFNNRMTVAGITMTQPNTLTGPFDLELNIDGSYQLADADSDYRGIKELYMNLKRLRFKSNDYSVSMAGEVNRIAEDHLPFGEVDVDILGFDKFKSSPFMLIQDDSLKDKIVDAVAGNQNIDNQEVGFAIKREKNGTLYVGETTFENLIGIIVTHALAKQNLENAPGENQAPVQAKKAEEAKSAPPEADVAPIVETQE